LSLPENEPRFLGLPALAWSLYPIGSPSSTHPARSTYNCLFLNLHNISPFFPTHVLCKKPKIWAAYTPAEFLM
jgi:hypothetical protein